MPRTHGEATTRDHIQYISLGYLAKANGWLLEDVKRMANGLFCCHISFDEQDYYTLDQVSQIEKVYEDIRSPQRRFGQAKADSTPNEDGTHTVTLLVGVGQSASHKELRAGSFPGRPVER